MSTLDASPPPGYGPIALLDRKRHAERGVKAGAARFASTLHAIPLTLPEFIAAGRSCPLVFARAGSEWQTLMIVGLAEHQNLCVDAAGDWRTDCYVPAYVRRYPFCTAMTTRRDGERVVCVDEAGLGAQPPFLFDARGEETPAWREIDKLIRELDIASRQTSLFCQSIAELGLLEPFDAALRPVVGTERQLTGLWRVAESRLNALPADAIVTLMRTGFLSRLYAHLMSLDNFQRLLGLQVQAERSRA